MSDLVKSEERNATGLLTNYATGWNDCLNVAEGELAEARAEVQKARKLLGQAVAALNPRNKLAEEIREFIIYSKMKP